VSASPGSALSPIQAKPPALRSALEPAAAAPRPPAAGLRRATSPCSCLAGGRAGAPEYLAGQPTARRTLVIVEAAPEPLLQVRSPDRWPSCRPLSPATVTCRWKACSEGQLRLLRLGARELLHQRGLVVERSPPTVQPRIGAYCQPTSIPISNSHFPTEPGPGACSCCQAAQPGPCRVGAFSLFEGLRCWCKPQRITSAGDLRIWVGGRARNRGANIRDLRRGPGPLQVALPSMARGEREPRSAVSGERPGGAHRSRWLAAGPARSAGSCGPSQRQMGRSLLCSWVAELGWPLPSSPAPLARLAGGLGLGWPGCFELASLELLEALPLTAGWPTR